MPEDFQDIPTQTDPIDKLYKTLVNKGYYTKSFDEFKQKYSQPENIDKLYQVVNRDGLYTKTRDEFNSQYFQSVKKKDFPSDPHSFLKSALSGSSQKLGPSFPTQSKLPSQGTTETSNLPSTSNLQIQATDARVGGDQDFNNESIGGALKSLGKGAALGFGSGLAGIPKAIAIASKKINLFGEYDGKKTEELATYRAGEWIEETTKDLVGELSPEEQKKFSVKLAQGFGNMATFMVGGIGAKALGASATLTTAAMGAAAQGSSEWENAIASGASPEEAAKVFWINAAIGSSEALPIMGAFRKLDKYTGGLATGKLAQKLASTVGGRLTSDVASGFVNEAIQESVTQILSNYTAQQTYDATRKIFDDVLESGAIGGIIGSTMSGAIATIREKRASGLYTPEEDAQLAKAEEFAQSKLDEVQKKEKQQENIINHATKVKENLADKGLDEDTQDNYVAQSLVEKVATEKAEKLTDPTLIKKQKEIVKEAQETKEQLLAGVKPEDVVTERQKKEQEKQQKEIEEKEKAKIEIERLTVDKKFDLEKIDAQIEETDGRESKQNRIKLKELNEKKKRINEDYQKAVAKLTPKEEVVETEETDPILQDLRSKSEPTIEAKQDLQYFIDKAGEDPVRFIERFGQEAFDELIPKVPLRKLGFNYKKLAQFDPNHPSAKMLEGIMEQRDAAESAQETVAPSTPSKEVADESGEILYHGTKTGITELSDDFIGKNTDNPTAQWGHFFTPDRKEADRYIRDFHGGEGNVIEANVTLKNPYEMSFKEFDDFTKLDLSRKDLEDQADANKEKAAEFKKKLLEDGYDGIVIGTKGKTRPQEVVTFSKENIKYKPTEKSSTPQAKEPSTKPSGIERETKTEIPKEGEVVEFSKVGKTKLMFDRANKKFTYETPTGRISSPKQAKLAASRITPRYFRTWWKEFASEEQKQQVRDIQGEFLNLLQKSQDYEYRDDIETFLMRMIKDVKFHESILKDLTDVPKSKWTTKEVDNIRKGFNLDTFVQEHIGTQGDGLLAQEGFEGYTEQDIMNMIKDIIQQYPDGIRNKDINDRVKEDNPLHQLERLEEDFLELTGLDINKALEIYGEEKNSLDKRQAEVQGVGETTEPKASEPAAEPKEKVETEVGKPPTEPPKPPSDTKGEEGGGKDKGILNRLYKAENVPAAAKKGFEEKGLKYEPKSNEENTQVAKGIIDELGIDEAVLNAKANNFGGGVNSAVFAESLNRIKEAEDKATTPEEKLEQAIKFADTAIQYDEWAREKGRDISQIGEFYKKSPLGVVIAENRKKSEDFERWAKPKDKSWKEFFEELKKEPEFEKVFKENVKEELKKERQEARKERISKVDKFFDDAKKNFGDRGAVYSTIIPPKIITAAIDGMKKAYHAGEKVAELVQEAIDYISEQLGQAPWDKEKFRKEWEEKLKDKTEKKPLTDEELKTKVLDRFKKKLKGLTEAQKDDVIRKAHKELIDNGALDFEDFKKIIARVVGRGELTVEEANRMKELVKITNSLEDAAKKARDERTVESFKAYKEQQIKTARAARELNEMFLNKPDIIRKITGIMQLNTLGIVSLINNPVYNIMNQFGVRFPIGFLNDVSDRVIRQFKKDFPQENNVFETQLDFWEMVGVGGKEAATQLLTGLNRSDYIQKELYSEQIRPFKALRDLQSWIQGKKQLSKRQAFDKMLQGTVGIPAEAVARMLNIGDKPQRFAAAGAQAAAFAKTLGLKDLNKELFMEFPREEALRAYQAQGLSPEKAGEKADYIKDVIIKEGERSTFQQENLFNDLISAAAGKLFGGKDTGAASLAKTLAVSPYIKIPSNAFWSMYNLLNPEIAILQSIVHGTRSGIASKKGETNKSKLQLREARYWMAHAIVGMATRAVVISLVQAGLFTPSADEDDPKKEREAVGYFDKAGTMQIGEMKVSNRWLGQFGMLANQMARQHQDLTPEQRENMDEFWNVALGGMELEGLQELENGVLANSSSLAEFVFNKGDMSRYMNNTLNLFTNIVQPGTIAQLNRAALDEVPSSKGDSFLEKLNQNFAQRSTLYRKMFDVELRKKRDIWGQTMPKGGNILSRMFGISKANPQIFARNLYDEFLRTNNRDFLPPAVTPTLNNQKLTTDQTLKLEEYVGAERKKLIEPYINDMSQLIGFNKKYSELNDAEKVTILKTIYDIGSEYGKERFLNENPQFEKPRETLQERINDAKAGAFRLKTKYEARKE